LAGKKSQCHRLSYLKNCGIIKGIPDLDIEWQVVLL
jgi:hypothetical protein